MKALLLAAAMLSASSLHAQNISAGLRSGVGFWKGEAFNKETFDNNPQQTAIWEKEPFIRYESGKHLAFEIGFNEVEGQSDGVVYGLCGTGLPQYYSWTSDKTIRDKYFGLNLRLQYGFSCSHLSRLRNYPGIALTPTLHVTENTDVVHSYGPAGEYPVDNVTTEKRELGMQLGVEDMIRYRLGPHFDMHSLVGYKVNVGGTLLQKAFTAQLGAAYVF